MLEKPESKVPSHAMPQNQSYILNKAQLWATRLTEEIVPSQFIRVNLDQWSFILSLSIIVILHVSQKNCAGRQWANES